MMWACELKCRLVHTQIYIFNPIIKHMVNRCRCVHVVSWIAKHFSYMTIRKLHAFANFSTPFTGWFVGFSWIMYSFIFCVSELPDPTTKYSTHSKFTPKFIKLTTLNVYIFFRSHSVFVCHFDWISKMISTKVVSVSDFRCEATLIDTAIICIFICTTFLPSFIHHHSTTKAHRLMNKLNTKKKTLNLWITF